MSSFRRAPAWIRARIVPLVFGVLLLAGWWWIVYHGNSIPFILVVLGGLAMYEYRRRKHLRGGG